MATRTSGPIGPAARTATSGARGDLDRHGQYCYVTPMASSAPRAAIYARLSRHRGGDQSASTRNQVDACQRLADERDLDVVATEVDDDTSAYSGMRRPGYERLLDAIEQDRIDVLLAWAPDRLHRSPRELEDFVDLIEAHDVEVATVQAGRVDLASPAGRLQARMLGSVARYESEHRSERIRLKGEQLAADGRWHGGRRPFGYRPTGDGRLEVIQAEAEVILEAVDRVLAGERVGSVANDLDARGVPTSTGARWSNPTLRGVITSPTIAGRRVYRGEDVGPGRWPAIVEPDTLVAVQAVLDAGTKRGRVPRVALLSGGRCLCAECDGPMRTARRENGTRLYRCPTDYVQVAAEPLEELVAEALLYRLDRADLPNASRARPAGRSVEELEDELAALAEDHGAGTITRAEWLAARKPLLRRIDDARAAVAGSADRTALEGLTAKGSARARWPELSLERRQAVLDVFVDAVVVRRAERRGPGLDPDRIDVRWKA